MRWKTNERNPEGGEGKGNQTSGIIVTIIIRIKDTKICPFSSISEATIFIDEQWIHETRKLLKDYSSFD